MKHKK